METFIPLLVGLWFPVPVIPAMITGYFVLAGPYSAVALAFLGLVVFKANEAEQTTVNDVAVA